MRSQVSGNSSCVAVASLAEKSKHVNRVGFYLFASDRKSKSVVSQEKGSEVNTSPAVDEVLNFVEGMDTDSAYFNAEEAEAAGASSETMEAGAIFNEMVDEQSGVSPQAGIPIWVNYCGPGHGGGTPVDTLDSYCQVHDQCYANIGYLNCKCDATLVGLINSNLSKMSGGQRVTAIAICAYFTVSPCRN